MGFLNSLALWGGLAAAGVAVPIIIHLLYRKHRQQTQWAAMELLRRALVIRSGQVRLEDLIILSLRCLALLLIALALLRPTLKSDSAAWGGERRVGMVVAVDASFSMNHGEHSRFEKAITRAKQILETAREGNPVTVVLMSDRPQILTRQTSYSPATFTDVLESQESPTSYRLSLERNLERLEELVSELKTPTRECYLVTDAQENDWAAVSGAARDSLERMVGQANVFLVPVRTDGEDNLSVVNLAYASGPLRRSGVARFIAEVRNEGRRRVDGGNLEFFVNDELVTRRAVGALQPGEQRGVSFFTSFATSGDVRLHARLGKDELADDNDRYAVATVASGVRVLCVDGDLADNSDAVRAGAYYAVRALRLKGGGGGDSLQVNHIQAPDLSLETLDEYDAIVLTNLADIAPEMVVRLRRFVGRGGGLMVFLGDRVDAERYNQRFGVDADGLLPGKLLRTVQVEDRSGENGGGVAEDAGGASQSLGWTIAPIRSEHALAAIVKRLPAGLVDTARFTKAMQVEPGPNSEVILTLAGGADSAQRGSADTPLLLSRRVGAGEVLLFTSSADRTWNQLPIHPLYTMLLQQSVTNLTSRPDARHTIAGGRLALPLLDRKVGDRLELKSPSGETAEVNVTLDGQQPVCAVDAARVGLYQLSAAGYPAQAVAVNVDASESAVRVVDAGALSMQLEPLGLRVVAPSSSLAGAVESARRGRELSFLLLMSGLVVFLLQSFLAKRFTDRMSHGEADVSASLQMSRVAAARRS